MIARFVLQGGVWERFLTRLRELGAGSGEAALQTVLALVIIGVGWLIAELLARVVRWIAGALLGRGAGRAEGGRDEPRHDPVLVATWVARWIVMIGAVMLAADVLGFELSSSVGQRMADLLPRVLAGVIVLAGGVVLAMLLGALTHRLFATAGFRGSRLRGQVVTAVGIGLATLMALEQLGLAAQFVFALAITAVAGVALAIGLAFGLGSRDLARDVLIEYLRSLEDESRRG